MELNIFLSDRVMKSRMEVIKNLRTIQLLNRHYNTTFREVTMPSCILSTLALIIVSSYASVKWFREVKTFTFVCAAMICIALEVWPTSAKINEVSHNVIRYLRIGNGHRSIKASGNSNNSNKNCKIQRVAIRKGYLWKVVKGTRPLCIDIGSYFSVKRITTATYIQVAIDITFQLLILY